MSAFDDLLGIPDSTMPMDGSTSTPPPTSTPAPTTATQQAAPGTTPQAQRGPQAIAMPKVVPRGTLTDPANALSTPCATLDFTSDNNFEKNLANLISKDLELAQHDRALAIALLQTHLDRAEVLDAMQLSMPVATVIADNSGVILKSLELAMKAGERVHKTAELIVSAQKNADSAALAALKVQLETKKTDGGWGDEVPT